MSFSIYAPLNDFLSDLACFVFSYLISQSNVFGKDIAQSLISYSRGIDPRRVTNAFS